MVIARKPNASPTAPAKDDRAAEAFIAGATKPAASAPVADDIGRAPVMLRFDRALLKKVDAAAKRRGISRSSWIQFTVSRALDAGEG